MFVTFIIRLMFVFWVVVVTVLSVLSYSVSNDLLIVCQIDQVWFRNTLHCLFRGNVIMLPGF